MDPHRPRIAPSLVPGTAAAPAREPPPPPEPAAPPRRSWAGRIGRVLLWLLLALILLALVPPGAVLWLRWNPPPTTAFMLRSEVQPVAYQWVPRERHPEALRRAVVAAEDQKFWNHWGFDFMAIAEALEHNERSRRKRGASTITQQTAKNLFLWPSRSYLRKAVEVTFTLLLEGLWDKDRILEVYLNVAEFGPGVYGVEAAARRFFGKPAEALSAAECARLAAVLPNPRKWRADRPGPYVQSRVDWILAHIGEAPRFSAFPGPEPAEPEGESGGEMPGAEGPPEPAADGEAPGQPMPGEETPEEAMAETAPPAEGEQAAPAEPGENPAAGEAPAQPPPAAAEAEPRSRP